MPLFHWDSVDALREYSNGDIVVEAPDVATARSLALAHAEGYAKEHRSWWYYDGVFDEDGAEDFAKWVAVLAVDLAKEPLTASVVFVRGSE